MTAANDVFTGLTQGNWYLVEGDKHLAGGLQRADFS